MDAQKDVIEQYADRRNLQIIGWYEETVTASKTGRPEFNKMVKNLKRGRARGFIVHKIDRSARNYTDWGEVHKLADAGIEIHVATENLDFGTRGGRLSADIQAVFAADYSRNLSDEVRKGQQKQIALGLYPFPAPLGYRTQGKAQLKVPDPVYAPFIKQAFKLYGSGEHSLRSLQKEMQRRGFRSKKGRVVSRSSLEKILQNPFYCGTVRLRTSGITYKGKHKKLISPALFDKVQQIKSGKVGKKVTKHNHTFRGLFHCAHCGGLLTGERQRGRVYYRCHTIGCAAKSFREDRLDQMIQNALEAHQLTAAEAAWLAAQIEEQVGFDQQNEEVRALKFQVAQMSARLEKLTNTFLDDLIDREDFQAQRAKLTGERQRLRESLNELSQNRVSDAMKKHFFERVTNVVENYQFGKPAEKRDIILWATSNRSLDDQNPSIEPQNWLREAKMVASGLTCGDPRANLRTVFEEIRRPSHFPKSSNSKNSKRTLH